MVCRKHHGPPRVVADALTDERFANNPLVTSAPHIRFYAGAPLITPLGHRLGTLCAIDQKPRTLDAEDRTLLKELSEHVMDHASGRQGAGRLKGRGLR